MMRSRQISRALLALLLTGFLSACSMARLGTTEPPFTYHEFDGIFVYYETDQLSAYRELLPKVFGMPEKPMVMAFFMDYYKMDAGTQAYKEAALFLLADYKGDLAWHCISMPVTTDAARIGGITYLGYPKIMGDIDFKRQDGMYAGELHLKNKKVFSMRLETADRPVTEEEQALFEMLPKIRSLNLLNGRIYEPKFGSAGGKQSLLEVASRAPDKFQVRVGQVDLFMDADAAGAYAERLGKLYSIKPTRIVLAFYMRNKFTMRFQL